jgi:hypothetical protein
MAHLCCKAVAAAPVAAAAAMVLGIADPAVD